MGKKVGRKPGANMLAAQEYGITKRRVEVLGGAEKLAQMIPDARAVLIKPWFHVPRELLRGGLTARGMKSKVPGKLTAPVEFLMSDEDLEATSLG